MLIDLKTAPLLVVAGALTDAAGRILLQKRKKNAEHGGMWEFPGGKIEPGEHLPAALVRELAEELDIIVNESSLMPVGFSAGETRLTRPIVLLLYRCRDWSGEPRCLDADAIGWFAPDAIAHLAEDLAMPPLDCDLVRNALGLNLPSHTI